MKIKKAAAGFLALAACLALSACGEVTYTFTFSSGGEAALIETAEGETPDPALAPSAPEGERIVCYLDASGAEADPFAAPAEEDAEYAVLTGPALAAEPGPWLEPDEYGLAHPDAPLTGAEAAAGVSAMFAAGFGGAERLAGLETVTADDLAAALEGCFAPSELAGIAGAEPLTRLEAASLLVPLYLDARCGEGWEMPGLSGVTAPDLDPAREGAAFLALCLRPEALREYEEGLVNLGGFLYRADENGLFLMDAEADGLYYGPDGRYTSGSEELDGLVAAVLEPICAEYTEREDMLRAAYEYVRDELTYLRRNYYETGETGWETEEAITMLSTGRGNCYNYAAAFWALARGLGYDAEAVSGEISRRGQPHGWVMIDGLYYDPETEMTYRRDHMYDRDMFAMEEARASQWSYDF